MSIVGIIIQDRGIDAVGPKYFFQQYCIRYLPKTKKC